MSPAHVNRFAFYVLQSLARGRREWVGEGRGVDSTTVDPGWMGRSEVEWVSFDRGPLVVVDKMRP